MSIFGSKNASSDSSNAAPRPRPSERVGVTETARRSPTYIAAGSRVEGEITGTAEVLVEGEFHGLVRLDSAVVVGKSGYLKGDVDARSVRIEGKVEGNVRGTERVEVHTTGSLKGNISAARVVIAEGAFFKGNVEMTSQSNPAPSKTKKAEAPPAEASGSPKAAAASKTASPTAASKGSGQVSPGGGGQRSGNRQGQRKANR